METATKPDQDNRELTPTEVRITLAQIEDRFTRVATAAAEVYNRLHEAEEDSDIEQCAAELIKEVREKFQIPYGVHLLEGEAVNLSDLAPFMRFAKWWVSGEMDEDIFALFCFHFDSIVEVDFFWVLMEQPAYYYSDCWPEVETMPALEDLYKELKAIGTRSRKKARMNFGLYFGHGMGPLNPADLPDPYIKV